MIYAHEHIVIDLSGPKRDADCRLDLEDETVRQLRALKERGLECVIDQTCWGMGRDIPYVRRVRERTGVDIMVPTGVYKEPFVPREAQKMGEAALAGWMIGELADHIAGTSERASFIGEIGTGRGAMTEFEKKVFRCACIAQKETGCPICTHTTLGTLAREQLAVFLRMRADLSHIVISHMDLCNDLDEVESVLSTGVNIAFDTIGKTNYQLDETRAVNLMALVDKGYGGQIVLSMDITRRSNLKKLTYAYLLDDFLPRCRKIGLDGETERLLCEDNPKRIYKRK